MRSIVLLALLALAPPATAQIYKCADAAGKLSYQDQPCQTGQKQAAANPKAGVVMSQDGGGSWSDNVGNYLESREAEHQRARAEQQADLDRADAARANNQATVDPDLQRKCAQERRSLLRNRNGTPSCDQLNRINGIQPAPRVIIQQNGSQLGGPPLADQSPRRIFDPSGNRWCWVYPNGAPMQCDR